MNESTEYEIYTKEIYNQIMIESNVDNINVEHNVSIKGKSGTRHQIDVYWEYQQFGELIKVAIECKNYSKNVSLGVVRGFKSVLDDLNCSKGIIVTTTGFQKGAIGFAKHNDISLKVIRPPKSIELTNIPQYLNLDIKLTPRKVKHVNIVLDKDWCLMKFSNMKDDFTQAFNKLNVDVVLIDVNGNKIDNLLDLENKLPVESAPSFDNIHTFSFDNAYIVSADNHMLKVSEVIYKYDVNSIKSTQLIDIHSQIKAIIKDCVTEERKFIYKQ